MSITLIYSPIVQTSESYDFMLTRNQIIEKAYEKIGIKTLKPENYVTGSQYLNAMVKNWAADEIYIWNQDWITLPLVASDLRLVGTTSYICIKNHKSTLRNKPGSGEDWKTYWEETSQVATVNWIIDVNYHSINNYWLDLNIIDIEVARIKTTNGGYTPLLPMSKEEYFSLGSPLTSGQPVRYFFNKQSQSEIFLYPLPDSSTNYTIELYTYKYPEDFDIGADNPDFLQEWILPLINGLAVNLSDLAGISNDLYNRLIDREKKTKDIARSASHEYGDIQIKPV